MNSDHCQNCDEAWQVDYPRGGSYAVWSCGRCGRVETNNHGNHEVIRDRQFSKDQLTIIEQMKGEAENGGI